MIAAAVFDFFDGMSARLLKSDTKIGKDLDSLADVVSFGAAPVLIYINMPLRYGSSASGVGAIPEYGKFSLGEVPYNPQNFELFSPQWGEVLMVYIPFLIVIFSAIRLAIFNNDTRQTTSFIGLPTPANGIMIASFALIAHYNSNIFPAVILNPWFMAGFSLLSCYLLVMPLPLFALKFKQWGFKGNEVRYLFLLAAAVLIVALKFVAIPLIIILYILLSLIQNFAKK